MKGLKPVCSPWSPPCAPAAAAGSRRSGAKGRSTQGLSAGSARTREQPRSRAISSAQTRGNAGTSPPWCVPNHSTMPGRARPAQICSEWSFWGGQRALGTAERKGDTAGNTARSWELSSSPRGIPVLFKASSPSCWFGWGTNTPTLVFATQNHDLFNSAISAFQATGHTGTKHRFLNTLLIVLVQF